MTEGASCPQSVSLRSDLPTRLRHRASPHQIHHRSAKSLCLHGVRSLAVSRSCERSSSHCETARATSSTDSTLAVDRGHRLLLAATRLRRPHWECTNTQPVPMHWPVCRRARVGAFPSRRGAEARRQPPRRATSSFDLIDTYSSRLSIPVSFI